MTTTPKVARFMTMTAKPGRGQDLATAMLAVAESLRSTSGCEIYLISREQSNADLIHITELWTDKETAEAALTASTAHRPGVPSIADVMTLLTEPPGRIDLVPLGGIGA
ncbi:MAG: putative quinol monooxygenase [Chloroflexota bacterium]